jgi:hypothetical protein
MSREPLPKWNSSAPKRSEFAGLLDELAVGRRQGASGNRRRDQDDGHQAGHQRLPDAHAPHASPPIPT